MTRSPVRMFFRLLFVACLATGAQAAPFVVTTTADGNNGACTVALCTLRDAVIAANAAGGLQAITLPSNASPYTLTIAGKNENAAATGDLDIAPGTNLTINGGGAATTIIDGGAIDRVFEVVSGATQLTLNDVTVRNGSTAGSSITAGGGILALGTTVILNNSIVTNNDGSTGPGGGIFATAVTMTNSTVSGNRTSDQGGGIFASTATISGSTISGNQSTGDQAGGLFLAGNASIANSTITANTAVGEGGAMYFNGSTSAGSPAILNITDSTISNNSSGNTASAGGLFILSFATVTISGSTFTGNAAGGGAFARDGGAIFNTGDLTIVNSTVSGNTASGQGGGITHANSASTLTIQSSTIASNTAPTGANLHNSQGTASLVNTIVANPLSGTNCSGTIGDSGGNMQFPGNSCGAAISTADPLLGPLANNGGPTQTRTLLAGSPAINAAVACPPPATDQRGIARPVGPACDIGAVEVAAVAPPPPTIAKSFNPTSVAVNGTSTLTFTIDNTVAGNGALTGVAFSDSLPPGVVVSTPNGLAGSCGGGTITATQGSGTVSLSGASLAAGASCTFSVSVTGTTVGSKVNTTGAITSTESGAGSTATATLTVTSGTAPPSLAKSFTSATIPLNGTTALSFTITNPNGATALSGVAFTDTLPAGLVVATPNGLSGSCGAGTVTATAGSSTIALSGGTIAAAGSCTFSVNVTGMTAGAKNNSVTVSSANGGQGNTANASVTVLAPATFTKAFGAATVAPGATTTLTFTLTNPNAGNQLTGVGFTDTFPAGLTVSSPNGLVGACGGGTITAVAGSGSVALSNATLAGGATCSFTVNVTATGAGQQTNVTGAVSSVEGGSGGSATASIVITAAVAPPATVIPTLQQWALIALALLLAISAAAVLRRRGS